MALSMSLMGNFTHGNEFLLRNLLSRGYKLFCFEVDTTSENYATDGWTVTAGTLAAYLPTEVKCVICIPKDGYTFSWDLTNGKLLAYTTGGTQVTNTTDLNLTVFCIALGR